MGTTSTSTSSKQEDKLYESMAYDLPFLGIVAAFYVYTTVNVAYIRLPDRWNTTDCVTLNHPSVYSTQ